MWFTRRCRLAALIARTRQSVLLPNAAWGEAQKRKQRGRSARAAAAGERTPRARPHEGVRARIRTKARHVHRHAQPRTAMHTIQGGKAHLLVGRGRGHDELVAVDVDALGCDRRLVAALARLRSSVCAGVGRGCDSGLMLACWRARSGNLFNRRGRGENTRAPPPRPRAPASRSPRSAAAAGWAA